MILALIACAPPCPRGWTPDPARAEALVQLARVRPEGPVCFGPVEERGLVDEEGHLLLDDATADALLAARLVHLVRHGATPSGPGCVEALRREESDAWAAELAARERLGVTDPTCPVAAAGDIEAWIATSDHPRAAGLRASHTRRCQEEP